MKIVYPIRKEVNAGTWCCSQMQSTLLDIFDVGKGTFGGLGKPENLPGVFEQGFSRWG